MKNVFVVGMEEHNHEVLLRTPSAEQCRFHGLLPLEELRDDKVDIEEMLAKARRILNDFDGSIDAIVGYWDFPVTLMVPILCEEYGLRSPSLKSVVTCEHKYWSRIEQSKVIDEHPAFALVQLDDTAPPDLDFPMWIKPVKSASSDLAFRVDDERTFDEALDKLRAGIDRIGVPFEQILAHVDLPPEIESVGGRSCLAEAALHGVQVAVEGYVYQGEPVVYSTLDSVDYPGSSAFLCHRYPSELPEEVSRRMAEVAVKVIRQVGLDNTLFSVEFFYDPVEERLDIVEINPRHSQAHAELFELVDGVPNHERMIRLALGQDPALPAGGGEYAVAGQWFHRRFAEDGVPVRVPTDEEVRALEESLPGVSIEIVPELGRPLTDLTAQDSYSFELAKITIGAQDGVEMRAKFERCVEELNFEFEDSNEESAG
ncbi:acetyl-CoA carboxylase biotin carboxylase subunit family protein [Nocardiopsis sp. Huas11]|uniref:ATP-grasp domain-containing protein n=1 Tax=Nocardiopsis sp. Huas11 TaxID=2183912 RepID=UPI0018F2C939|nr:ATP-grasp domain-containing protein [Nocardiopsis sp. Huas11]